MYIYDLQYILKRNRKILFSLMY